MSGLLRPALLVALASSLAACASDVPQAEGHRLLLGGAGPDRARFNVADPSKVIAAELAFARAAQEKGQWTAFAEFSADDAVMFVPEPVDARDWLRKQQNPSQAVRWQPHQVWSSCDGSLAVTKGAWQRPDGTVGYFTTVWERQRNGEYKWVMDQGDVLAQPLQAPELIDAKVAACSAAAPEALPAAAGEIREGRSRDGTLRWRAVVQPDGSRTVEASYWDGSAWREAIRERVSAG